MFFGRLLNLSTSASATISQAGSSITYYTLNPLHSYDHIRELDTRPQHTSSETTRSTL